LQGEEQREDAIGSHSFQMMTDHVNNCCAYSRA